MTMASALHTKWLIPVQLSLLQRHHIITPVLEASMRLKRQKEERKSWFLVPGPIRIGQGIEFDFCSVHQYLGLSKEGYETDYHQQ